MHAFRVWSSHSHSTEPWHDSLSSRCYRKNEGLYWQQSQSSPLRLLLLHDQSFSSCFVRQFLFLFTNPGHVTCPPPSNGSMLEAMRCTRRVNWADVIYCSSSSKNNNRGKRGVAHTHTLIPVVLPSNEAMTVIIYTQQCQIRILRINQNVYNVDTRTIMSI